MKKKIETNKENQARSPKKPAKAATERDVRDPQADSESTDVIDLILRDHKPLKNLIQILKDGDLERAQKEAPLEQFVPLLIAHAKAEEQSLYVQMKEAQELRRKSFEGDTEHALAEQLVHEINASPDDDEWNAKVKVLAELVEHHIEEEEETILKDVEQKMDLSLRQEVGEIYTQLKTEMDVLNRPRSAPAGRIFELQLN